MGYLFWGDTLHVTCATCHIICVTWKVRGVENSLKFQVPSSYGLGATLKKTFPKDQWVSESLNQLRSYLCDTSGSQGLPKGFQIPRQGMRWHKPYFLYVVSNLPHGDFVATVGSRLVEGLGRRGKGELRGTHINSHVARKLLKIFRN